MVDAEDQDERGLQWAVRAVIGRWEGKQQVLLKDAVGDESGLL